MFLGRDKPQRHKQQAVLHSESTNYKFCRCLGGERESASCWGSLCCHGRGGRGGRGGGLDVAVVVVITIINHGGIEVDVGSVMVIVLVDDGGCGRDRVIDADGRRRCHHSGRCLWPW